MTDNSPSPLSTAQHSSVLTMTGNEKLVVDNPPLGLVDCPPHQQEDEMNQTVKQVRCPSADTATDGTAHTILGCGSANVVEDESEPGTFDCLDCGICFWGDEAADVQP